MEEVKEQTGVRPDVINYDDVAEAIPKLAKYPKLVNWFLRVIAMDKINETHGRYCHRLGVDFATALAEEEYKWNIITDNYDVLQQFKTGPFITVSNHPIGSYDGIILLHLVGKVRPD